MRGKRVPPEIITAALLDAATMGTRAAAKKHGVSRRLLVGERTETAPVCATLAEKRLAFLMDALDAATVKVKVGIISAKSLARLIEVVGDLDLASRLTVERPREPSAGESAGVAAQGRTGGRDVGTAERPGTAPH